MSGLFGYGPRARGAAEVRGLVRRLAVGVFGAGEVEQPVEAAGTPVRMLDDPLVGVRAARLVERVAAGQMRDWALAARGAGHGWDEVAAALGLPDREDGPRPAELAYEYLIEHRCLAPESTRLCQRPVAFWRCTDCGARVRDTGPFESHPDDREHGHTGDCARHEAARVEWLRRVDEAFASDHARDVEIEQTDEPEGGGD